MSSELDRMAWSIVIGKQDDMELIATAASGWQVLDMLNSHLPDAVLIDEEIFLQCDYQALLDCVNRLHSFRSFRLILVAMHEPDYSTETDLLIHTRLLKGVSAPKLLDAIRTGANEDCKKTVDEI
jgi:DNA-binding NarL/FixJ family response regulator